VPIQFRCHKCRQVLSITSKKAGLMVNCPSCREATRVPTMEDVQAAIAQQKPAGTAGKEKKPAPSPKPADATADREAALARERAAMEAADAKLRAPLPSEAPVDDDRPPELDSWEEGEGGEFAPPGRIVYTTLDPDAGREIWAASREERNPWVDEEADEEDVFKLNRRSGDESGLDMTPMVDVTFLLLIFFMITASFNVQKSMPADPPEPDEEGAAATTTVEEQEQDMLIVGISDKDELTLDDEPIGGISALADALKAKAAGSNGEMEMTIEADPRCTIGIMVGVMDIGTTVGMQRIKRVSRPVDD
jgi:biopolymer transport protein ExbD